MTALMLAANEGQVDVITKLVELDVDVAAADNVSARHSIRLMYGNTMFGKLTFSLLRFQEGRTVVMWAAGEGHVEAVAKLAELGADIRAVDNVSP